VSGTGNTTFQNITFENLGVIEAATGTLFLPATFTHTAGILRPTGGSIGSQNSFDVAGGTLEGSGTILRAQFISGLISPGGEATGDLRFPTGLILNPAVTVRIHANGTAPGTQHDRLRVVGLGTNFVNYRIEASTNLTDWIDIATVPSNGGGEFQFDDPESDQLPERLYRAIGP